ncbi:LysR family transcriptional regulator [Pantoea sp. KPR_PJ]|uniref:LysR family transcriptional regulator n=1 Tax=Pantoea sp. KPR_PJ TaxID=2738375 RepID=UPI0035287B1D
MNTINIDTVDLNLFKVFEALYDERSASRAAIRLDLTQPAVSAALGRLRKVYGDPLFVRTGRGLHPTRCAEELSPVIRDALNRCRQGLSMSLLNRASFAGRILFIGLSDDYEIAFGRAILSAVENKYPGLRLAFKQLHSSIAADALMKKEVDIAVSAGEFSSATLDYIRAGSGGYACLMDDKAEAGNTLSLNDFVRYPHLLVSSGGIVGAVDEALRALKMHRIIKASVTHFSVIPFFIRESNMIVTLPRHAAEALASSAGLRLMPCPISLPEYDIRIAWKRESRRDAVLTEVRDIICDVLQHGCRDTPSAART